jgi:AraC-like DNA-binding protein
MQIPFTTFEPKIAIQPVRSLINYTERLGLDRSELLKAISLSEEQLNDSRLLIDVQRFEELYVFASGALKHTTLGFEFGKIFEADRWGILGYIAITSLNLGDAMSAQHQFQTLSGNMGAPILTSDDKQATLQWAPAYNCSHHVCEQIIAGFVSLARTLTNRQELTPEGIFFTHEAHGEASYYENYFNCPVKFNATFNGILIHHSDLISPIRQSDMELNEVLIGRARAMLAQQTSHSPMEVIKGYIVKTLPDHNPEIEEAAQYLGLSVRSTQRKLQEYGTSFSQVLDAIRKELALTYLRQTQNSVLYISERLGFSEQSAFQRAFKRWTGSTPRQYRTAITQGTRAAH